LQNIIMLARNSIIIMVVIAFTFIQSLSF